MISKRVIFTLGILLGPASVASAQQFFFRTPLIDYENKVMAELLPAGFVSSPACYDPENLGTIGQSFLIGCGGRLIVSTQDLRSAASAAAGGDGSFEISHEGEIYSFENSALTIFTGQVTNFSSLFENTSFNGDIGHWDMTNASTTSSMFRLATNFNQDISNWNTRHIETMNNMFLGASTFNQNLNSWNVSSALDMNGMFRNASNFNGNISGWNTTAVVNMSFMFNNATSFNRNIGTWNTSSVSNMSNMFNGASNFNQNLSGWCVENISSEPSNFASLTLLSPSQLPVWGTCPEPPEPLFLNLSQAGSVDISGTVSEFYSVDFAQFATESNVDAENLTWTRVSGSFPSGLFLDGSVLSGIPDVEGSASFSLQISFGTETAVASYTVSISPSGVVSAGVTDPACYTATPGSIGNLPGCDGMLIVDNTMIRAAASSAILGDQSFDFKPSDSYWAQGAPGDPVYTFEDSEFNIFTGQVTDLSFLFRETGFNGDIGYWDTSNVQTLFATFFQTPFNQDIGSWDVSSVENMFSLFRSTSGFNQSIASWDVSNVTDMTAMFMDAQSFNQDLTSWCVVQFSTEPNNFSVNAPLVPSSKPLWGSCPQ